MPPRTVGLLHPGEMGAAIGAALRATNHRVIWASAGRSAATRLRAADAGLEDLGEIAAVCASSDVILSVVPPGEATAVAATVSGFDGIYVDANAISPSTANRVSAVIHAAGASCVDGGIIGNPPVALGDVRFYVSGPEAAAVVTLFTGTVVDARVAGPNIGDASAVKVAYAGWTKGTTALLLTLREYASRAGVDAVLLQEWSESQPALIAQLPAAANAADGKGWRWIAEMYEIAGALDRLGLPSGFHEAAADVYSARRSPQ
jgi:3-hydroxyisobutyrate dehydrogenase-like beta-hydroxyacid dehydrogenase